MSAAIEVTLIDHMGTDLSVVNAARVSFEKESTWDLAVDINDNYEASTIKKLSPADTKLVNYLAKHKHTSPFNHAFATFRVKAPIFVARQLVKHKFMPWNEVSRRYVSSAPEMYAMEWREAAENVKQGSGGALTGDKLKVADEIFANLIAHSLYAYEDLLDLGVCPEQARAALLLNTMTEWIWSGSLGAIADMCILRLDNHSQAESRTVAALIANEMEDLYPVSWAALMGVNT